MQVILPSSPIREGAERAAFEAGCAWLGQRCELRIEGDARRTDAALPWLAGDDRARGRELSEARADALWMGRGGTGAARTLLHFERTEPVVLWAFSDGTTLIAEWCKRAWPCWMGPPLTQIGRLDEASLERLEFALRGEVPAFTGLETVVPGVVRGPLAGGNLAVLASLVGTPQRPRWEDAIVVLEDVGEVAYRVDRMLQQLRFSGAFDGIAGVALGDFTGVSDAEAALVRGCLEAFFGALGRPCVSGLPVGHGARNAALPMGRVAHLDASRGVLRMADGDEEAAA